MGSGLTTTTASNQIILSLAPPALSRGKEKNVSPEVRASQQTRSHRGRLESSPDAPRPELSGRSYYDVTGGRYDLTAYIEATFGERLSGYQFRYSKLLDPNAKLTSPVLPYSR